MTKYYVWAGSGSPWITTEPVDNLHGGLIREIELPEFIDLCIIAGTYPQITLI